MPRPMPLLTANGTSLFYDTAGTHGPRVMLIQGAGAIGEAWRPQIADLAADHQLVWFDNRGIGKSVPLRGEVSIPAMAGDSVAVLDHLGWDAAHIVGHSMGGIIAQHIGLHAPARTRSLALLSTLRRGRSVMRPSLAMFWPALRMRLGSERSRWLAFCDLALPRAWQQMRDPDTVLALLRPAFCSDLVTSPPILNKQTGALWRHTGPASLEALAAVPTLILTGALDRVVASKHSDELARQIRGSRLERIPDAGHAITIQCADTVNRLLREHIAAASS